MQRDDTTLRPMTPRQQRFVEEYLICGVATRAAIRAGYSAHSPQPISWKLMSKPHVAAAIREGRRAQALKAGVSAERVLTELARLAFSDLRDFVRWGPNGVELRPAGEISPEDSPAIADITVRASARTTRTRVRLHDKQSALDALARYLGLYGGSRKLAEPSAAGDPQAKAAQAEAARANRALLYRKLGLPEPPPLP